MKIISYLSFMKKYYIYHIKGKKIGCTIQPKRRTKTQGFDNYEILEEHTDIYIASDREIELQKEWGYQIDTLPYWRSIKMTTKETCIKTGNIALQSGHLERIRKARQTPIIQMDKLGNVIQEFESGKITANTLNLDASSISACCKGKLKSTGGFTFKYK